MISSATVCLSEMFSRSLKRNVRLTASPFFGAGSKERLPWGLQLKCINEAPSKNLLEKALNGCKYLLQVKSTGISVADTMIFFSFLFMPERNVEMFGRT